MLCIDRKKLHGDDGAAMLLTLLAIVMASMLSLLILGVVVAQTTPTVLQRKSVRVIHGAEAGLDSALGTIRNATYLDATQANQEFGDRQKLPCGTITGTVDGTPGSIGYQVQVRYYLFDPVNKTETWRAANAMLCTAHLGTQVVPKFALLQSEGTGDKVLNKAVKVGDRRIETIYDFTSTNRNLAGGLVRSWNDSGAVIRCWDAGSVTPVAGAVVKYQPCDPLNAAQLWSWRSDFTMLLSVTQASMTDAGMCLNVNLSGGQPQQATVQPCNAADFNQKVGFHDNGSFTVQAANKDQWCLGQESDNVVGTRLMGSTAMCGTAERQRRSNPTPQVGAGSAGVVGVDTAGPIGTDVAGISNRAVQFVNFSEFGRCLDITNWTISYDWLIAYPCKQKPRETVGWNQAFTWTPADKLFFVREGSSSQAYADVSKADSKKRCLRSPNTEGGHVRMSINDNSCNSASPDQQWTVKRNTGVYAESYQIVDAWGRCLSLGAPDPNSGNLKNWSRPIVETCSASTLQKWNAPPTLIDGQTRDTQELPRTN